MTNDISLSTLVISAVIAGVGWLMKKGLEVSFTLLIDYIKKLLTQLSDTTTKVTILDLKMGEVVHAVADINKIKTDLNAYYLRLKNLEDKFESRQQ